MDTFPRTRPMHVSSAGSGRPPSPPPSAPPPPPPPRPPGRRGPARRGGPGPVRKKAGGGVAVLRSRPSGRGVGRKPIGLGHPFGAVRPAGPEGGPPPGRRGPPPHPPRPPGRPPPG